jgi:hypothetical protein
MNEDGINSKHLAILVYEQVTATSPMQLSHLTPGFLPLPLQLNLIMNNDEGEGVTSTYVANGEWHLIGNCTSGGGDDDDDVALMAAEAINCCHLILLNH